VFRADGTFVPLPPIPEALLERGFRRAVLDFLVRAGVISEELRRRMLGWRYSGFSVHNQVRVAAEDAEGSKKLAAYMLRAPLALAKMSYDAASGTLNLPLEDAPWAQAQLPGDAGRPVAGAALQAYSRSLRATRQVRGLVLEPQSRQRARRRAPLRWRLRPAASSKCLASTRAAPRPEGGEGAPPFPGARLIRKVYEADPLVCPKCQGPMRVIALIADPAVVRAILTHLGLWQPQALERAPPAPARAWPEHANLPLTYHPLPDIA